MTKPTEGVKDWEKEFEDIPLDMPRSRGALKYFIHSLLNDIITEIEGRKVDTKCADGCPFCGRGLQRKCNAYQEEKAANEAKNEVISIIKSYIQK